jgi:dihydroorotate dehydrogenase electron transfer subunit
MSETATMTLGEIIENKNCAPGHFQMGVRLPLSFADPTPGQFVMVRSAGHREPLLSRPLSVFGYERYRGYGMLSLLYRVAGEGTALLSRMQPGDPLSILGPLGTGFSWSAGMKRPILIAGGIGAAPLIYLMKQMCRRQAIDHSMNAIFYLGAQTEALLTGLDHLEGACDLRICTDDGSRGTQGVVTEALKKEIPFCDPADTALFACGPGPMVRALAALLPAMPFPCQVSLEERMACGLGACLGCAVAVRSENGTMGYQRVCKDGPVFDLRKIYPTDSMDGA